MKYSEREKLLRREYLPYIKGSKKITKNVIKNYLIKLKEL